MSKLFMIVLFSMSHGIKLATEVACKAGVFCSVNDDTVLPTSWTLKLTDSWSESKKKNSNGEVYGRPRSM